MPRTKAAPVIEPEAKKPIKRTAPKSDPVPINKALPDPVIPKEVPAGLKIPKTLAGVADLFYEIKQQRLAADKVADALKKQETFLSEYMIANVPKSQAGGVVGKLVVITLETDFKPTVEDWPALYAYVKRNNAFELLQRRLGDGAVAERWAAGKTIPGVGKFTYTKLSVKKR